MGTTARKLVAAVILLIFAIYVALRILMAPQPATGRIVTVAPFSHVFIIVMENHGTASLVHNPNTPYIDQLLATRGVDTRYDGVTHPSLPNYLALISGSTQGQLTDSPTSSYSAPTVVAALRSHGISWQAVMQSIPRAGYSGAWYPNPTGSQSLAAPPNALYAKKHDPFEFFTSIRHAALARHTTNLRGFARELQQGTAPKLVFITPNLCHDMHGQPNLAGASCPVSHGAQLERLGDQFLATWVKNIERSPSWSGNAVIFILWDEANYPAHLASLPSYLQGAPGTPAILGIPLGGGRVPLIVIDRHVVRPESVPIVCNHYCVLKTIQSSWHLGYLGATNSPQVKTLVPLVPALHSSR